MGKETIELQQASRRDMDELVDCAVAAFEGNPLFTYLTGPGREYAKRAPEYFRFMLRITFKLGEVWYAKSPRDGMMLLARDSDRLFQLRHELAAGALGMVGSCGIATMIRSMRFESVAQQVRREYVPTQGDHLFVYLLAVDPARQGSGLGTLLLEHAHRSAAKAGLPVILETMTPENVQYYRNRGYTLESQRFFAPGDFTFCGMIHPHEGQQ